MRRCPTLRHMFDSRGGAAFSVFRRQLKKQSLSLSAGFCSQKSFCRVPEFVPVQIEETETVTETVAGNYSIPQTSH